LDLLFKTVSDPIFPLFSTIFHFPLFSKLATKTQQRQLKVKAGFYHYQAKQVCQQRSDIAQILLKGKWLHQAGFQAGENVTVRVMHGCLVITSKEK